MTGRVPHTRRGAGSTAPELVSESGRDSRERLLSAATDLFGRYGYEATTVRQIVWNAGVTAPALYYHFGSKEGLLLAVVQRVYGRIHEIADRAVCQGGTVKQCLCNFADGLSGFARECTEMGRLFGVIQCGALATASPAPIAPHIARFQERLRSLVQEGVSRGEFRAGTSEAMVRALLGAVSLGLRSGLPSPCSVELVELKDVVKTIMCGNGEEDLPRLHARQRDPSQIRTVS